MRIEIFDLPIDNITFEEVLKHIDSLITKGLPSYAVAINPEKALKAYKDRELTEILKHSNLNFVDGVGIIFASSLFKGIKIKERITGIDLFSSLLAFAEQKGYSVFFLGAKEESIKKAIENIKSEYPNLKIAGFHNGYFEDESKVVSMIRESKPDILFIGMGSPKQEKFIYRNLNNLNVKFAMGVGGSFNVFSKEFKRAPAIVQKLGLEWLYRFLLDPKRLPRILSLPKFLIEAYKRKIPIKEEVDLIGIKISNRTLDKNIEILKSFIKEGHYHIVVTINGEMLSRAIKDKEFLEILRKADLVIPDGIGVIMAVRRFGERITNRIPGIEFAWEVLRVSEIEGYRVFFLGAQEEVIQKAVDSIKKHFSNLNIVGFHNGYFTEDAEIRNQIVESKPHILFVGMGGIKQEKWIEKNKDLDIPVNIGIGGSFDVWSGKVKRAPLLIRKLGVEWLYRTIVQPKRFSRLFNIVELTFKIFLGRLD